MAHVNAVGGTIDGSVCYRYDLSADVLYLKRVGECETETYADVTDDGDFRLLAQCDNRPVGLTVIGWWERFGHGSLPDSIRELSAHIEPWAGKVAA